MLYQSLFICFLHDVIRRMLWDTRYHIKDAYYEIHDTNMNYDINSIRGFA